MVIVLICDHGQALPIAARSGQLPASSDIVAFDALDVGHLVGCRPWSDHVACGRWLDRAIGATGRASVCCQRARDFRCARTNSFRRPELVDQCARIKRFGRNSWFD